MLYFGTFSISNMVTFGLFTYNNVSGRQFYFLHCCVAFPTDGFKFYLWNEKGLTNIRD